MSTAGSWPFVRSTVQVFVCENGFKPVYETSELPNCFYHSIYYQEPIESKGAPDIIKLNTTWLVIKSQLLRWFL